MDPAPVQQGARVRVVKQSLLLALIAAPFFCAAFDASLQARALVLAAAYLVLALGELVAPFVPTLFLLTGVPILLGPIAPQFQLSEVLGWMADPVLILFAGGFALGDAAHRHRLDATFAALLLRASGHSRRRLVGVVLLATAGLSMWMSNVAAAALVLATLRPMLATEAETTHRRALLLAVAVGANLGGMATPLGSGPNAIAIAAARSSEPISFLRWMSFGVPIVLGMLLLGFVLLVSQYRVAGRFEYRAGSPPALSGSAQALLALVVLAIGAWLSEPLHGVGSASIALMLMLALFAGGLLERSDLNKLDWSTLGLIAGGLAVGRLLQQAGLLEQLAATAQLGSYPRWLWLGALVVTSAVLAALMSNTATAALLIPLGLLIDPSPSTAIIIAVSTSFGMMFPISTPPNAMVYGSGEVRIADLLRIGLPLMLVGCVAVTFTGSWFLGLLGFNVP